MMCDTGKVRLLVLRTSPEYITRKLTVLGPAISSRTRGTSVTCHGQRASEVGQLNLSFIL